MTYEEAISFWFDRINFEVKSARPQDLKLERMRAFLAHLGNPHERIRTVHVTGTKGKGSTCAMLTSVLQQSGYRVGLFTSPHLVHVEERIQVNGQPIRKEELVALIEEVAPIVLHMETTEYQSPTFFEIGTALGFLHFLRRRVDLAIVEVGLGGRFDSTNVITPLVAVITSIGWDHMAQLGQTLEAIAFQKAGIIKQGVPTICGVTEAGPAGVIHQVAREHDSPLDQLGLQIQRKSLPYRPESGHSVVEVQCRQTHGRFELNLIGDHQATNAAIAIAALDRLREAGLSIPEPALRRGLVSVNWPARVEVIRQAPWVILDTAHNVPSAEALISTLRQTFPVTGRKVCVFAVSSDKQYEDVLRILSNYFDEFILTKYGNNPRCVPPEKLAGILQRVNPTHPFSVTTSAADAWQLAYSRCKSDDLLCITGSVFLAGELQSLVREQSKTH